MSEYSLNFAELLSLLYVTEAIKSKYPVITYADVYQVSFSAVCGISLSVRDARVALSYESVTFLTGKLLLHCNAYDC